MTTIEKRYFGFDGLLHWACFATIRGGEDTALALCVQLGLPIGSYRITSI